MTYAEKDKSDNYGISPYGVLIVPRGCYKEKKRLSPRCVSGVKGKVTTKNYRDFEGVFYKTNIIGIDLCEKISKYKSLTGVDPCNIPFYA